MRAQTEASAAEGFGMGKVEQRYDLLLLVLCQYAVFVLS